MTGTAAVTSVTNTTTTVPYFFQGPLICADTLNEWDGERVQLVGLVSLVYNGQGHPEAKVFQVPNLKIHTIKSALIRKQR